MSSVVVVRMFWMAVLTGLSASESTARPPMATPACHQVTS